LSFENDKNNLEIMRNFALKTLKKYDMNRGYVDLFETTKNLNKLNTSQGKEEHKRKKDGDDENIKNLIYVDMIFDYSENFRFLYKMMDKENIIWYVFNDKNTLFKLIEKENVYYFYKKKVLINQNVLKIKILLQKLNKNMKFWLILKNMLICKLKI